MGSEPYSIYFRGTIEFRVLGWGKFGSTFCNIPYKMPDDQVFARSSQLPTSGRVSDTNSLISCADARGYAMEHWSMLWLCFCFACGMVVFMGFYCSLDSHFARCIPMMAFSRGRRRDVMFQCCLEDSKSEACPAGRK